MRSVRELAALADLPERLIVGLLSGTSADGADAALVRVRGHGAETEVDVVASLTAAFPAELTKRLRTAHAADAQEVCRLNVEVGGRLAAAAIDVIAAAGLDPGDAHLVGSHGQTVVHLPGAGALMSSGRRGAATLQIGSAAVIAERTGLPVISDFRQRDVAAGGEGAPLAAFADWLLLRRPESARVVLNLGGIANATVVTPDVADVRACDVGPANGPLDAAAEQFSGGTLLRDVDGRLAAAGEAVTPVVEHFARRLLQGLDTEHSLAREDVSADLVAQVLDAASSPMDAPSALATLTEIVAQVVAHGCVRLAQQAPVPIAEVIVSGGGVHNLTLMARLAAHLHPLPLRSSAEIGIDPDAREAVLFALLANETLLGGPGNLPAVTNADGPRVLGTITP